MSEEFIEEFQDEVNWDSISIFQRLSEDFIREFQNKVNWFYISIYQILSKEFIIEFNQINNQLYEKIHKGKTYDQKLEEIKEYAEKHNLKFDGKYLYCFRKHDKWGCGYFNKTIRYESGKYYHNWRCDMRENQENSFSLGIWPRGNTPIRVKVEDWGVAVNREDGKARVWGFEVL